MLEIGGLILYSILDVRFRCMDVHMYSTDTWIHRYVDIYGQDISVVHDHFPREVAIFKYTPFFPH